MSVALDGDPRWCRLHDPDWICPCCGMRHAGLFDLALDRPHYWRESAGSGSAAPDRTPAQAGGTETYLTRDLCVLDGTDYFVRCVLLLPVIGAPGTFFGYGVWSTLAKENFDRYVETFDSGDQGRIGPWFGWFASQLKGYPSTLNLKCRVHPQDGDARPEIELEATDHPLAVEQHDGITFDRILEVYAANGHDMREALAK